MTFITVKNHKDIKKAMDELDFQQAKYIFLCYSFKYFYNEDGVKQ